MNFLAHLYLSGQNPEIMVGNFIADSVKGSKYQAFPEAIQVGILMHRFIDSYTDQHPVVKNNHQLFYPTQGKYAPVVTDIVFDHFLAKNWSLYHTDNLRNFCNYAFKVMEDHREHLVGHSFHFFEYAKQTDRLFTYQFINGIEEVFKGMHQRVGAENRLNTAINDFYLHYNYVEKNFEHFFPELEIAVKEKFF